MSRTFVDLGQFQSADGRAVLQQAKKKEIAATITPDLADQLGKSYTLGRFASPELLASAAVAGISGIDDLYKNLQTQLLKQGIVPEHAIDADKQQATSWTEFVNAKPGQVVTIPDPRTGKPITLTVSGAPTAAITAKGQQATGLAQRTPEQIAAQEAEKKALEKRVPVYDMTSLPSKALMFGGTQGPSSFQPPRSVGEALGAGVAAVGIPFHYAGAAISMMSPDFLKPVGTGIRATTKAVTLPFLSTAEFGYNLATGILQDAYHAGKMDGNLWDRFMYATSPTNLLNNIEGAYQSTTLVQVSRDLADGKLDVGGGFFVQGKTGERARENWKKEIGTIGEAAGIDPRTIYDPKQRAYYEKEFSPGILAGDFLVDGKLTSRDSELYQAVSDVTDLGVRIGLDPLTYYDPVHSLGKYMGMTKQAATDFVSSWKAGRTEEAIRIATEAGMDAKVAENLANADRQLAILDDMFQPKEHIVYSGDRSFTDGKDVTSFLDVNNPDFVPNTQNLFGEGLYVTDQPFVASTQGYNVPGAVGWDDIDRSVQTAIQEVLPEGANTVASGVNKGAAGVWKFDKSNLNILDGEKIVGPGDPVFDLLKNKLDSSAAVKIKPFDIETEITDLYTFNTAWEANSPTFSLDSFKKIQPTAGTGANAQELFDAAVRAQQRVVDKFPDVYKMWNEIYGFGEEMSRYLTFQSVEATLKLAKRLFASVDNSIFSGDKPINQLVMETIDALGNQSGSINKQSNFHNIGFAGDAISPALATEYWGFDVPQVMKEQATQLREMIDNRSSNIYEYNGFMGDLFARTLAPFSDSDIIKNIVSAKDPSTVKFLGNKFIESAQTGFRSVPEAEKSVVQKMLIDAGYDGMSYDGGKRIGGASTHTATVIWKPSKLQFVDILSGEKFPINQAVSALEQGKQAKIAAEEIQNIRDTIDGYRKGFGLIDDAPRTVDPNNLNAMRYTTQGRKILQAIADESDPVKIWRNVLKQKSPNAAIRLAEASTPDEVWKVLEDAVYSGDPNTNIRELPNGWRDWVSDTGYKVKSNIDRYSRQTAMMPDSTYIPFDDPSVALQRADRILQVSGVRGAERDTVLNKMFDAIKTGSSKAWDDFFEAANEKALVVRMKKAGWTKEEQRLFSSYRWRGDATTRWTLEDLADNIPIEWFDEGDGPLRITQLLSGGGYMMEPKVLDRLIRDLNPLVRGFRKITKQNPQLARIIDAQRTVDNAIEASLRNFVKPAALGAPLPIRYVMRVVPEEMLRVAFSHEFDNLGQYVSQIYSGHLNYDTFGRPIMDAKTAASRMAELQALKDEYSILGSLTDPADIAAVQKRINKIEAKYGTLDEIQQKIDDIASAMEDSVASSQRALVNRVRGHVDSTYDPGTVQDYLERSKVQEVVSRQVADPANITAKERQMRRSWVTAQARDIAEMTANKDYQAIAKAIMDGTPDALERVAQSFLDGDLQKVYDEYTKNVFRVKTGWNWDTIEAARSRVNEIRTDIMQRTGAQPDVLRVIADGKLGDQPVVMQTAERVYEATDDFKKFVRETLLDHPDAPNQVPYYPSIRTNSKAMRNSQWMYSTFGLYTQSSAALARNPLFAQAYWKRVAELAPVMSRDALETMLESVKGKLPDYVVNRLEDTLPLAKGEVTQAEASAVAAQFARETTDKLLWNAANNKSYFGYRHQIMFMFFDAYREQWQTWLKLLKSPRNLHAIDMTVRNLQQTREPFTQQDNYLLHNDPTTGKQVVTVPFSRWVYNLAGGDAQLSINTRNLSLVGSVAPGFSPVITLAASSWKPQDKTWANMKTALFPYATGETSLDPRDYMIPQFWQYFAAGTAGVGRRTVPSLDTVWNLLQKSAGPIVEKTKKASLVPILRQLSENLDKYPPGEEGRKQLLDDANKLADQFSVVRAVAKAFLPASPTTNYYVKTKAGNVMQGVLLDEIRKTEQEVLGKGGTLSQAITTLLDRYGLGIWSFFGSGSQTSIPGLQPTKEYQDWFFSNKKLVDKYPFAGGYLGPQDGEYNNKIYVQQMLIGQRSQKDPKAAVIDAENLLAEAWWDQQNSTIPEEWSKSDKARIFRNNLRADILKRFPNWNPLEPVAAAQTKRNNQILEIEKMANDPKVQKLPVGPAIKEYVTMRSDAINKMIEFAPTDVDRYNWTKGNASISLRQYLFDYGTDLAKRNPAFNSLWSNILVKEFDTKDLSVPTGVQQ